MRRQILIALGLLLAVLVTVSTPGTRVAGDDTIAAQTAGLALTTAPAVHVSPTALAQRESTRQLLTLLIVLCLLLSQERRRAELRSRPIADRRSILERGLRVRRGPPTTA